MSKDIKQEDLIEKDVTSTSEKTEEVKTETVEQDPLKTELERVQNKDPKKELEKASKSLHFNAQRVKELGGDPNSILGVKTEVEEEDDDKPVTRGDLKRFQAESASKSALQQADEITNESERELVKYHLQNTIKSTGNPTEDMKLARALVNAVKNTQIIEEVTRKTEVKTHSNSSGVDAKQEKEIVWTPEELEMMKAPFKLTPKEILESRAGKKFNFNSEKNK